MRDVETLLVSLGGYAAVARETDTRPSTPAQWAARGSVPVPYWPRLIVLAARRGLQISADALMRMCAAEACADMDRQLAALREAQQPSDGAYA